MSDPETCDHDPDDAGDTCCTCGKIMTEADRHEYEMKLRARAREIAGRTETAADRHFADYFLKQRACTHEGYAFTKHGRRCSTCGASMVDFGD